MNAPKGSAAPASGSFVDIVDITELFADPEIAALLDFDPVPRLYKGKGGWTPDLQREFIARLAFHGSPGRAAEDMSKDRSGLTKLYKNKEGASFRAAWDAAVALAEQRKEDAAPAGNGFIGHPPSVDHRRKWKAAPSGPLPGQILNEFGEWEDEASCMRRAEEAKDSISKKLLRARRLYLQEISTSAGKRAAFEILTELPIDWEKAKDLEAQPDEPFHRVMMRKPDMLLTAENGWMPEIAHGPDKKAELRKAVDDYLAEEGLPPVEWDD